MILVTGATGFIGSHLIDRLVRSGSPVRALVRRMPSARLGVEFVSGDLTDGRGLDRALEGVDTVIHLAGVTKALRSDDYYTGNLKATERLVVAVGRRPVRFVHVSSLAAVGPASSEKPLPEDVEAHPLSHYGRSKYEAERTVRELLPHAVIVRPPVVYGPRDTGVFQILKAVSRGFVLQISGGERWFNAIYVDDLVEGLLLAARSDAARGRSYFISHPEAVSWSRFTDEAARIMGRSTRVVHIPLALAQAVGFGADLWSRATRTPGVISRDKIVEARCRWWLCDTRRASTELGFQAATSLETGLTSTLAWYKEAGWLKY